MSILVTGGTKGIGLTIALRFSKPIPAFQAKRSMIVAFAIPPLSHMTTIP